MNSPEKSTTLSDMQSNIDERELPIDFVGIKGIRYPIRIGSGSRLMSTIATLSMTVGLSAATKGTHMSRFIELLEAQTSGLGQKKFKALVFEMLERLGADSGEIEIRFPFFITKTAPMSGVQSQLDYDAYWRGNVSDQGLYTFFMNITVLVTSLCPCSKNISDYGAHNQRSHINIEVDLAGKMAIPMLDSTDGGIYTQNRNRWIFHAGCNA